MPVIAIPKPLRDKLGEEATDGLTEVIRSIALEARKDALALAQERLVSFFYSTVTFLG